MTNLKVFAKAADNKDIVEVDLAAQRGLARHEIHPHTIVELTDSTSKQLPNDLSDIANRAMSKGEKDGLVLVTVGLGDPTSVPSDTVLPQATFVARKGQPALKKAVLV